MKQTFALLLTLLLVWTASAALAQLGDPVQDFTVVGSDGSFYMLGEMLKTKKAVYLNFFASWCDPCLMELPTIQAAYAQYGDEIGFIVASVEMEDTPAALEQVRTETGLDDLPLSLGGLNAFSQFQSDYIPLTVMVNADGTIGYIHEGAILDEQELTRILDAFAGGETVYLEDTPEEP